METIISSLHNPNQELHLAALKSLLEISQRNDTTSLKLLIDNKDVLTDIYNTNIVNDENKKVLADILSTVYILTDPRLSLTYRLIGNVTEIGSFGHQYIKKILGTIVESATNDLNADESLFSLLLCSLKFLFEHNCECDAIDFMVELGIEHFIPYLIDHSERVEVYLSELCYYIGIEYVLFDMYRRKKDWVKLVIILLRGSKKEKKKGKYNLTDVIKTIDYEEDIEISYNNINKIYRYVSGNFMEDLYFILCKCNVDEYIQILFILSRVNVYIDENFIKAILNVRNDQENNLTEITYKIMNGAYLSEINSFLHKDLQLTEPFPIEKFLKGIPKIDKDVTLKYFTSISISNGFVHRGYTKDSLFFTKESEYYADLNIICETDKLEIMAVLASIGMIKKNKNKNHPDYATYDALLESYMFSSGFSYRKSGALLAHAFQLNTYDDDHSLFALLAENLSASCRFMKSASLLGIENLYCGSNCQLVKETLIPILYSESIETVGLTCFTLGSCFYGTMDDELINVLMTIIIEKKTDIDSPFYLFILLGFSLLFLGCGEKVNVSEEFIEENNLGSILKGLAYLGTGRSDIIEELVDDFVYLDDRKDEKTPTELVHDNIIKGLILLSITLISLNDTHTRTIAKNLLSEQITRDKSNIIPLCLSLLYASEPDVEIVDAFSRSINGSQPINTILGLGIVGAGTNNTRIQNLLETQYAYHAKNTKISSMLKIAQGLVCLGKGTLSLSPLAYDKTVILKRPLIGLLGLVTMFIYDNYPLLSKHSLLFYLLEQSIGNKFVVTLNQNLEYENVNVRVGRPVQTVGMAGKPKGLSGIVMHESPVIIQCDEKGDIYEDEGYKFNGFVEDVLVVKKRE